MRRKVNKEKIIKDVLNANLISLNSVKIKPPISGILSDGCKPSTKLKDKVTSLVQMQLKHHQINQNYLIQDNATNFINNYDNDKKESMAIYLNTKYEIVEKVAKQMQFKIVKENENWNILWIDGSINSAKAFNLKRNQRVNHFPGMNEISRKDKLQRNLKIMQRYFPLDYNIFPKTWSLPTEKQEILSYLREQNQDDTFIIKPACSSQGRGIILMKDVKSLSVVGNTICQLYISNPFLIDGYKFDLRIYVLITSCDPFRIYIYEEGLARFATHHYEKPNDENLSNVYMHLTNYSVQRNSSKFNPDEITGTKRRASTIYEWFKKNGYDARAIWKSIDDVIIKTMLCANTSILHHYTATFPDQYRTSACFELLGFDIILDENLKPFVLEVNHSPSLETETNLDIIIKSQLLTDIFNLLNSVPTNIQKISDLERIRSAERLYWSRNKYMSSRKASYEFRKILTDIQIDLERVEMDNKNRFRILYPILKQTEKYQKFFDFNCETHRSNCNKYSIMDESEHRRFVEIQKDSFPGVLTKVPDVGKLCKFKPVNDDPIWKAINQNMQSVSKDLSVPRNMNSNVNTIYRFKDYGSIKNSNILLDTSTRSLRKILSHKNPHELTKLLTNKKPNFEPNGLTKKLSISSPRDCGSKLSRAIDSEFLKSPVSGQNLKMRKPLVLNKGNEMSLNQQTSAGVEWESSLSSNKVECIPQINIELQNKTSLTAEAYLDMFQNSLDSTVQNLDQSSSSKCEQSLNTPNSIIKSKEYQRKNKNFLMDNLLYKRYLNEEMWQKPERLKRSDNLLTNRVCSDLKSNEITNEKFTELSHSKYFDFNSHEFQKFAKIYYKSPEMGDNRDPHKTVNNKDNSETSFNGSNKFSNGSTSSSELHGSNALYAAEIEEHPGLLSKLKSEDTVKYFQNSRIKTHSATSKLTKNPFGISKCFDIVNSMHLSESKTNLKFDNEFTQKKHNRSKDFCSLRFQRNQTVCKRKHVNNSLTFYLESNDTYSNNKSFINYMQPIDGDNKNKDNFNPNTVVEIDQDVIVTDDPFTENVKYSFQNDTNNKSIYLNTDISVSNEENGKLNRNDSNSFKEMANKLKFYERKRHENPLLKSNSIHQEMSKINSTKKRKPIIKNAKVFHQRISTYDLKTRFTIERCINHNSNITNEKFINIINDDSVKDDQLFEDDIRLVRSTEQVNTEVCEINISPSIIVNESIAVKKTYNFTISLDSNHNSLMSLQGKLPSYSNSINNDDEISQIMNNDSIYHDAMVHNKNTNHLFESKVQNKKPVVLKYFRQSMKKLDEYVDMCMGNNPGRYVRSRNDDIYHEQTAASKALEWYPVLNKRPTKTQRFKLPEITIRGFNNIIHLFPNRKHKNKSFNLIDLKEKQIMQRLLIPQIDSNLKNLSITDSIEKYSHINELPYFTTNDCVKTNRSLMCKYLKNVSSKNKNNKSSKFSSTKRLCKILTEKTNNRNNNKPKLEEFPEYPNKLVLQYMNY